MSKPLAFLRLLCCLLALAACGPTLDGPDDDACEGIRCTAGECVSNAGQPMCRCGPWEQAAGLECAVGDFAQPDDHGGSPPDATVLTLPMGLRTARIDESDREGMVDRDLFAFTAGARHVYAFQCGGDPRVECKLRLLDASGHEVNSFIAQTPGRQWLFATVGAGTWYVEVSGGKGTGRYTYQLQDLGLDDHGDDAAHATALQASTTGEPFLVTHSAFHDQDVFSFRSRPGHAYRFTCEASGPGGPTRFVRLGLRTARGVQVDGDSGEGEDAVSVSVSVRTMQEADWLVWVSPVSGAPWGAVSSCRLEDLGLDDHSDTWDGATPITPGVPLPVTLHSSEDADVFTFTGAAGHIYTLGTEQGGGLRYRVVDASGNDVASLLAANLSFELPRDGTYFIQVREGDPSLYSFRLLLTDRGIDDHGDSQDTATPLVLDTLVTARFETRLDVDAFTFDSQAEGIYLVTCEPACALSLHYWGRVDVRALNTSRYLLDTALAAPITLLLQPLPGMEHYTLRVTHVATDDHPDTTFDARPLTLPVSVSGVVQSAENVDTLVVWLVAGRRYRLAVDLGRLELALNGPNGAVVLPRDGVLPVLTTGSYSLHISGALDVEQLPWSLTLREE